MRKVLRIALFVLLVVLPLALFATLASRAFARVRLQNAAPAPDAVSDPWSASQTVLPDALSKELGSSAGKPTVVCVGFRPLYIGAHIPGALFHGSGSTPQGITDLKTWAQDIPRSANIVLYCGCCPLLRCPNIKPAFLAMRDLGFTNLRVLLLPHDFNTDWIEKGYATEKGK